MRSALKEAWSVNRESTNRNRIRGDAFQGERAIDREALTTKGKCRKSGDCAMKAIVLTWGDLALLLKGRPHITGEREVSRGHSSGVEAGKVKKKPELGRL